MPWQRNDDQYGVSRKVTRLSRREVRVPMVLAAVGLDQLAKNYAARALTDGVLDSVELEDVFASKAVVDELERVEMIHRPGHVCERCVQPPAGGIVIHDYLDYNPSRAEVESERERDRNRKRRPKDSGRNPRGGGQESAPPPNGIRKDSAAPDPVPVPETDIPALSPEALDPAARDFTPEEIESTVRLLSDFTGSAVSDLVAMTAVRMLIESSPRPVAKVVGYVVRCIDRSPVKVRATVAEAQRQADRVIAELGGAA